MVFSGFDLVQIVTKSKFGLTLCFKSAYRV